MKTTHFIQGWLNLHKASMGGGVSKKSYPRSGSQREGSGAVTKELMKKRILILAVLRREIERLSIWRNPKNLTELRIHGEDIVQVINSFFLFLKVFELGSSVLIMRSSFNDGK